MSNPTDQPQRKETPCSSKHNHLEGVYALRDADGIFLNYVCDSCRKERLSHYREDILTRSSYEEYDWGSDEDGE
jgi:hypothetical protein